jgi:hypothetical protein
LENRAPPTTLVAGHSASGCASSTVALITGIQALHAVVQEVKDAGVFVFAGGLDFVDDDVEHTAAATDGMVTDNPYPQRKELIGGFMIVDVPTRETDIIPALAWCTAIALIGYLWANTTFTKRA